MPLKPGHKHASVYALLDPRDSPPSVRYVGATRGSVSNRFSLHLSSAIREEDNTLKGQWIRDTIMDNSEPLYMLLERVPADQDLDAREAHWISVYAGLLLTNQATGGKGAPGVAKSERTKIAIGNAFRGITLSDEHRCKISQAKMGHDHPEHVKEALLRANLGRKQTDQEKRKKRESLFNNGNLSRGAEHAAKIAMKVRSTNTSGYPGVRLHKTSGLWQARIVVKGKEISLGYHKDVQDAVLARQAAEMQHFGKLSV